ncbi:hypothetical protein [Marinoscillum sp.]|uniref:hypothetical protein n=1 Tax=Marinoscillum sp. TaxID=2024838 RepID=UPI003BAAB4D3
MRSYRLFNLLFTLAAMLWMMTACESDIPQECQDITIVAEANSDSTNYTLIADLQGLDNIDFEWFVNDQLIASGDSIGTSFDFSFAPGVYSVCIQAESEQCGTIDFCTEVVIRGDDETPDDCPELKFEKERMHDSKYLFKAEFRGMDSIAYVWYVDGDSVESEPLSDDRHHKFDYEFEPGTHTVCIKAQDETCGELEYCQEIIVETPTCPEVSFYKEADGENAYWFYADFEGKDSLQYKWYINGEYVDKENFEGHDTDHKLYWQFGTGEYRICLKTVETDGCDDAEYCMELEFEGESSCPDMYFEYEKTDSTAYSFFAEFEGMNDLEWYAWKVDGSIVDEESGDNRDHFLSYIFAAPGEHEVCLVTETPDCPEAVYFCKTILVDPLMQCVDLSFSPEEESNGYIFTADFEERDEVTYIWKVYKGDDYQGGEVREAGSDADHDFFWEFEPGVEYTICLRQDGCENNIVCETFMID